MHSVHNFSPKYCQIVILMNRSLEKTNLGALFIEAFILGSIGWIELVVVGEISKKKSHHLSVHLLSILETGAFCASNTAF